MAFEELIRRYERVALSVAYGVLHDAAEAGDATQEAFLRAWQRLNDLQDPRSSGPGSATSSATCRPPCAAETDTSPRPAPPSPTRPPRRTVRSCGWSRTRLTTCSTARSATA